MSTRAAACGLVLAMLSFMFGPVRPAQADNLQDIFDRGNTAYARGDYEAAVSEYETLQELGVRDPDVSADLGNAYARQGRYGQAIRHYERALLLAPRDEVTQTALAQVRRALSERQAKERGEAIMLERPSLAQALFAWLTEDEAAVMLLVGVWLLCACLAALAWRLTEARRLALGVLAVIAGLVSAAMAFGLWAKDDFGAPGVRAVVLTDATTLREGPDEASRSSSELSEGEVVRLLERRGGFAHVLTERGRDGFVARDTVGAI